MNQSKLVLVTGATGYIVVRDGTARRLFPEIEPVGYDKKRENTSE
jgi:hypothetical protein